MDNIALLPACPAAGALLLLLLLLALPQNRKLLLWGNTALDGVQLGEASSSWLRLPSGSIIRPLLRAELTEGQDQEQDHQQESHYMYLLRNRISFGGLLSQSESAAAAAAGF